MAIADTQVGVDYLPQIGARRPRLGARSRVRFAPWPLRGTVEVGFYVLLLVETFRERLGLGGLDLVVGGMITAGGLFTLCVMRLQREALSVSFVFLIAMNVAANLSLVIGIGAVPLLDAGLSPLLHCASHTLIVCYLVRQRGARNRVLLALGLLVLLSAAIGGVARAEHFRPRFYLEGVGGTLNNANDLAYWSGLLAVALLFQSRSGRSATRALSWALALPLAVVCLRTLSRGGALALACGLTMFAVASVCSRRRLVNLALAGAAGLMALVLFADTIPGHSEALLMRFREESFESRIGMYRAGLGTDLRRTLAFGLGPHNAVTTAGVAAHNSFVYTHMAYGGLAAWAYLLWMLWLARSVARTLLRRGASVNVRLMVAALFAMMLVSHGLSNSGYVFMSSIYAAAVIEQRGAEARPAPVRCEHGGRRRA